jgi:uncharacterized protein (DUF4415 family)
MRYLGLNGSLTLLPTMVTARGTGLRLRSSGGNSFLSAYTFRVWTNMSQLVPNYALRRTVASTACRAASAQSKFSTAWPIFMRTQWHEGFTDGWTIYRRVRSLKDKDIHLSESHPELDVKHVLRGIVRNGLKAFPPKQSVSLRLDVDDLNWFKSQGAGYQTRIDAVLRAFMDAAR